MQNSFSSSQFLELFNLSFFNQDESVRAQNESYLTNYMNEKPEEFVDQCCKCFSNSLHPTHLRKTISTVLKLAIKPSKENRSMSIWPRLSMTSKELIKETGLVNLVDSDKIIKNTAASLVADVFILDCMGNREWVDLLGLISENLNHEDSSIQQSALLTIGYICEELHSEQINNLKDEEIDSMTCGICLKLKSYDENTLTALKALEFSLNFLTESLKQEALADYIMNLVTGKLIESFERKDIKILKQTIIVMSELTKILFINFEKYFEFIFLKLMDCYSLSDSSTTIALNEYFFFIIEEEKKYNHFPYTTNRSNQLTEKCIESLLKILEGELKNIDLDEVPEIILSCSLLMVSLNTKYFTETQQDLFNFVSVYIIKPDETSIISALCALEAIIAVPCQKEIQSLVMNVFNGLVSYLDHNKPRVRLGSIRVLSQISKNYSICFFENNDNINNFIHALIKNFEISSSSNQIKYHLCDLLEELIKGIKTLHQSQYSILTENKNNILIKLITEADNTRDIHYIDKIFSATMKILSTLCFENDLCDWFNNLWSKFSDKTQRAMTDENEMYLSSISINLNVILQRMIFNGIRFPLEISPTERTNQIFETVFNALNKSKDILNEPLHFLTSYIELEPEHSVVHMETFLSNYLKKALENKNIEDLFISGINCVGDLLKIYQNDMKGFVSGYIDLFFDCLEDMNSSQTLKTHIFFVLSDISSHCSSIIICQIERLFGLVDNAFQAVFLLQQSPENESKIYANNLKTILSELMLCIIHGVFFIEENSHKYNQIKAFFPKVINFIQLTTQEHLNPTIDYMRDLLMLIYDYTSNDPASMYDESPIAMKLHQILLGHQNHEGVENILQTKKEIAKLR